MESVGQELMKLQLVTGKPVVQDGRRMSVISLAFTLKSVSQLAGTLFGSNLCRYICTGNLDQDPLEMYFSCVRQRGGWNNNPSASEFRQAYRRTPVHAAVGGSQNAPQLEGIKLATNQETSNSTCDEDSDKAVDPEAAVLPAALDHDYFAVTTFASEVVKYIGGFVVRSVTKHLHCAECAGLLVSTSITSVLTLLKDNGGLIEPSQFVQAALHAAEQVLRQSPPTPGEKVNRLTLRAFQELLQRNPTMLQQLEHYHDKPHHNINLKKVVIRKYMVLRVRAIARQITERSRGTYIRHILTKRVLFAHQ
ncbi:hypothetical protein HPB48_021024 [Haemaphysalis longicornis]|uniref:Transposable element P transposase-like RNase H C-terminal domain-containing protein n=1 Tax=Haemaphysalis longicornis TaxID=44386 RepID=A0A9J6GA78_HAELO|nr:hypothetical protein HPB48_021024 [Haemaphysalis longicornis]